MSNWQETCKEQLFRLEKAAVLADKLTILCSKAQSDLSLDIIKAIDDERPRLERQLERLRANRFEVAVIGLEKAGKSALLNAWLGQEILPSEGRRCTYTTTEILSAPTEDKQQLSIEYYSCEEIDNLLQSKKSDLKELKQNTKEYRELETDIKETEDNITKLYEYARMGKNKDPIRFKDIAEINNDLYSAVAGSQYKTGSDKILMDRSHPRSIKRIQLKTTRLSGTSGIVFHDVPGFNSTVTKHRLEAEKRMEECDVIIFAKKMDNFNLDLSETNTLSIADADHIKLEQKIFVVLTQCDKALGREQYDEWLRDNKNEWEKVPAQRIVPVCAIAHLADLGTCNDETIRDGILSTKKLQELGVGNGIEQLKKSVDDYIDVERSIILKERCDKLVGNVKEQANKVFNALEPIYNQAIGKDIDEDDLYEENFGKWWVSEWSTIRQEFQNWYQNTIEIREGTDGVAGEHTKLTELRDEYNEEVKKLFSNLKNAKSEEMESTYKGDIKLVPVAAHGNKAIRDKLYTEIQKKLQEQLTNQLTGSLKAITYEIVSKAKQSLFNIDDVERILLENPILAEQKIHDGFETLLLRFGRVAVDTFIALPLHDRPRLLKEYEPEIRTLEAFYGGPDKDTKGNLTDYLRAGLWVIKQASAVGIVPPIIGEGIKSAENWDPFNKALANPLATSEAHEPQNFPEVEKEIKGDLMALQDYLQNSVFHAAGFITYSKQELHRIRERFTEENQQINWYRIVLREAKRRNPNIPSEINNCIQDFRLRREIALEIKETREIYMDID